MLGRFQTVSLLLLPVLCALVTRQFVSSEIIDIRENKVHVIEFTEADSISREEMTKMAQHGDQFYGFIGDLVIGERQADESIFRRTIEVSNPTDGVYKTTLALTVNNGVIHYLRVNNVDGSYAVACDDVSSLGSSKTSFNLRVPPRSSSNLLLFVAAH